MQVTPPLPKEDSALEVLRLKDMIFSDLSGRGVQLEPLSCRRDGGGTIVRFAHGGLNLAGACIRFRVEDRGPTVITVIGPSDGWSRSWQRRRDDSFDVVGIADYVVSMIEHERAQPSAPELEVPSRVPPSTSGLYALFLAAVRLRASATPTTPEELLGGIGEARGRAVVERRLQKGGLKEADLRRLALAASLDLYRPNNVDFDPSEPQGRNLLPIALVGNGTAERIESRYVLVLDYEEHEVLLADPAGEGLVTLGREAFLAAWRLAERRGLPWVGLVSPASRSRQPCPSHFFRDQGGTARLGDCGVGTNEICSAVMPASTLVYLGHYETSFRKLHADQDHYWTKPETQEGHPGKPVDPVPDKFRDGVQFGFMQTTEGFIFVRINRLVLPTPVLFIGKRHGPEVPGPGQKDGQGWPEIGPDVARNILADAIVANPGFRDELIRLA